MTTAVQADSPGKILGELRKARGARRFAKVDRFEALYRVYLAAFVVGTVAFLGSDRVTDAVLTEAERADLVTLAPSWVALIVALAIMAGIRSGSRGGPLVIEAADVYHVLLAPIPRALVLRPIARRRLQYGMFVGGVGGLLAGLFFRNRLNEHPLQWTALGTIGGATIGMLFISCALIAGGLHLRRWLADLLGAAIVAWAVYDVLQQAQTFPVAWFGRFILGPLSNEWIGALSLVPVAALAVFGIVLSSRASVEAARRRSALVSQIRFAATLQDLRAVTLLRRQLSGELPRQRPWFVVPHLGDPVVTRSLRSFARWPIRRLIRSSVLGIAWGLALVELWNGTTPMMLLAGLIGFAAALDATDALGEEIDHPSRLQSTPIPQGVVLVHHVAPVIAVTLIPAIAASITVGVLADGLTFGAAALIAPGIAIAAACGAIVNVVRDAPGSSLGLGSGGLGDAGMGDALGMAAIVRIVWPPALALLGTIPLLVARESVERGNSPAIEAIATGDMLMVCIAIVVAGWVRFRNDIKQGLASMNPTNGTATP